VVLAAMLAFGACTEDNGGGHDAADAFDAADGQEETDDDGKVDCDYGDAFVNQFDRSCGSNDDCAIGLSGANCCGTMMAVGINHLEQDRFKTSWATCATELERCRCPVGPTEVDDGNTTTDHGLVEVACTDGSCRTYLP
jgi:hypothetical protein